MPSTELARIEPGSYLALRDDPAEIQAIIEENLGGQDVGEFDLPRIKVPSGGGSVWEVPTLGGIEPQKTLTGIVVYFKSTRAYWTREQDGNEPPACRSDNAIIGIGEPGGPCKTCPLAQFGTAIDDEGNAAPGQACNQKELWFMLLPGSFLPVVVALPATSLKAAKQYRVGMLGSAGLRLPSVVTSLALESDKNGKGKAYSKAIPSVAGMLEPAEVERAVEYASSLRPIFDSAVAAINNEAPAAAPTDDTEAKAA
jgi:hypothetical protein